MRKVGGGATEVCPDERGGATELWPDERRGWGATEICPDEWGAIDIRCDERDTTETNLSYLLLILKMNLLVKL